MVSLISDISFEFLRHRRLAERAIQSISDEEFVRVPVAGVNSVALIVKHLSGNLASRWGNFHAQDGESPHRDRDAEFVLLPEDTRESLMGRWGRAWDGLQSVLQDPVPWKLEDCILIRGEPHRMQQALLRRLTHTAYHVGQILLLCRWWQPAAPWLTIPPGESRNFHRAYLKMPNEE